MNETPFSNDAGDTNCDPRSRGATADAPAPLPLSSHVGGDISISVKEWRGVAGWAWDTGSDQCLICRNALTSSCVDCQLRSAGANPDGTVTTSAAAAADDGGKKKKKKKEQRGDGDGEGGGGCVLAWGACGHVYHLHCLRRWAVQRESCPLCGQPWVLARETRNN